MAFDGPVDDIAAPTIRQRQRLLNTLGDLPTDAWQTPSRCAGWTVQDVAAHLAGVNQFWSFSIAMGVAGKPSKLLTAFDPASTPADMVAAMTDLSPKQVLAQLTDSTNALEAAIHALTTADWDRLAEAPPGHIPIRLVAHHALWDCWVHERDICLPLGLAVDEEPDELAACLRYSAAVGPSFALGNGRALTGVFGVAAHHPEVKFTLTAGDTITVKSVETHGDGVPCLTGSACDLIEMLSIRMPIPADTPNEWVDLLGILATTFTAGPAT